MLIRNLNTDEIFEVLTMEFINGSGEGGVTLAQVNNLINAKLGKFVSLGFNGTLSNNVLTFTPPIDSGAYTINENYEYELDLHFAVSGTIDDNVQVEIDNNGEDMPIQFYTVTHNDVTTPITWAEFKKLSTYDDDNGYRWLIKASYHVTNSGIPCFVIYPTITKQ